jgi:hypothetical protein
VSPTRVAACVDSTGAALSGLVGFKVPPFAAVLGVVVSICYSG